LKFLVPLLSPLLLEELLELLFFLEEELDLLELLFFLEDELGLYVFPP